MFFIYSWVQMSDIHLSVHVNSIQLCVPSIHDTHYLNACYILRVKEERDHEMLCILTDKIIIIFRSISHGISIWSDNEYHMNSNTLIHKQKQK